MYATQPISGLMPSKYYAEAFHRAKSPHVKDALAEGYYCARARERNEAFLAIVKPEPPDTRLEDVIRACVQKSARAETYIVPRARWNERLARKIRRFALWVEFAW
jgi:hypothetical protein